MTRDDIIETARRAGVRRVRLTLDLERRAGELSDVERVRIQADIEREVKVEIACQRVIEAEF